MMCFTAMLSIVIHFTALVSLGCAQDSLKQGTSLAELGFPPLPDFKKNVDYVTWYTDRNFSPTAPLGEKVYADIYHLADPGDLVARQLGTAAIRSWTPDEFPELAAYVKSVRKLIPSFLAATKTDEVRWDISFARERGLHESLGTQFSVFRQVSKVVMAASWFSIDGKSTPDGETLIRDWTACLNCAKHIERSFGIVPCLLSASIRGGVFQAINRSLELDLLDEQEIERTLNLLTKTERLPMDEAYRFDLMMFYDILQRLYPDGKPSDSAVGSLGLDEVLPAKIVTKDSPDRTAIKARSCYRPFIEHSYRELSATGYFWIRSTLEERVKLWESNELLNGLVPALDRPHRLALLNETMRRGTTLALAISLHKKREGRWPASLADLKNEKLAGFRIDPYSPSPPFSLAPSDFVYRLRDGLPILYSVGFDGEDNKGRHNEKAYYEAGGDIVVYSPPN